MHLFFCISPCTLTKQTFYGLLTTVTNSITWHCSDCELSHTQTIGFFSIIFFAIIVRDHYSDVVLFLIQASQCVWCRGGRQPSLFVPVIRALWYQTIPYLIVVYTVTANDGWMLKTTKGRRNTPHPSHGYRIYHCMINTPPCSVSVVYSVYAGYFYEDYVHMSYKPIQTFQVSVSSRSLPVVSGSKVTSSGLDGSEIRITQIITWCTTVTVTVWIHT